MADYPLRHISIRVPWHDSGWNGTVCSAPHCNEACLRLARIAAERDEEKERSVAGQSLKDLPETRWPCCVTERATFMAPFEFVRNAEHPYHYSSPNTHGHFAKSPLRYPPYSAAAVPFRWMFSERLEELRDEYELDVDANREPDLGFQSTWVQDRSNQAALLNCFRGHLQPDMSLCFFYAKQVPFVEQAGRVLIGVGRVKHVGELTEYSYTETGPGRVRSFLWECMIQHSIRPGFRDGFVLPYRQALDHALETPDFDPATVAAMAPEDHWEEFSYASELASHDAAISSLLACAKALEETRKHLDGPWDRCLKWIHDRLGEIWRMRGPSPGLGAALCAFGVEYGTFVAREIECKLGENEDPWALVEKAFGDPRKVLSKESAAELGTTIREKWACLPEERMALLQLISRFDLTPEQAKLVYKQEDRKAAGIDCSDRGILENPYRLFELTRLTAHPVSIWTVDRGVFPDRIVRDKHALPEPSHVDAGTDRRRVRALTVHLLERGTGRGDTVATRHSVVRQLSDLEIQPGCEADGDLMAVVEKHFPPEIDLTEATDGARVYQLARLTKIGQVIRNAVRKRVRGNRLELQADWRSLLDDEFGEPPAEDKDRECLARQEKAAALEELAESRFSVLIGAAGTGKTTLLAFLCGRPEIVAEGVLLMAPTGKARVRLEQAIKGIKGYTIAQFLSRHGRYDGETGRYHLGDRKVEHIARTVIIDEASMLTEEMLAGVIDALTGVHRLILVGDPGQLPPIGSGRPFIDIVGELAPDGVHGMFPRIANGYAELTIRRRQTGSGRVDLQLAAWFAETSLEPGEDEAFERIERSPDTDHLRVVQWDTSEKLPELLDQVLLEELRRLGIQEKDDQRLFDLTLGGSLRGEYMYFNRNASGEATDNWQILSPVRGMTHGVNAINRHIHRRFRAATVEFASRQRDRLIPRPVGPEQIVYGDKVINIRNHKREDVWPPENALQYVANGEIGVVVGQFKTKKMKRAPEQLKIEFSSQLGVMYTYWPRDFKEEAEAPLELAYALTIHKAQGSEFGVVLLVLPNPCWLLSREILYTAMTRQKQRVVLLHQGPLSDLRRYASTQRSRISTRLTNLFVPPAPVAAEGGLYEERLIHQTSNQEFVRSKSEVIIANSLAASGVEYMYEKPLTLGGRTRYPDFTVEDPDAGAVFYWEHCGMLHDPDYRSRWERKRQWYLEHGIKPVEEGGGDQGSLIVTRDDERGGISSPAIEAIIRKFILGS